jgi:large subunit ribosomal protein L29
MEAEKIRNTTDAELLHQQRELSDQLFRLRFQLKMGQTESLKKLRGLRKDIARIKTVIRERQLGLAQNGAKAAAVTESPAPAAKHERKAAATASASRSVKKKAAAPKKKTAAKGKK